MEFIELVQKRFSCRKFESKKVEKEKIESILKAAQLAPTAVNKQPFKVIVIDDEKTLDSLKECTKYTFDAPLCFAICVNKEKAYNRGYDGKNSADIDGSIVTAHMMLEATDLGLGTTWVMAFNPQKAAVMLNIPDNTEVLALLPTGYPAEDAEINPLHFKTISFEEMASYNKF